MGQLQIWQCKETEKKIATKINKDKIIYPIKRIPFQHASLNKVA